MLETALVKRNCSLRVKITVKTLVSAGIVVLAVLLPQLVHLAAGGRLRQSRLPHIRNIPMKCILEKLIKSIMSYDKRLLELIRQPFMLLLCPQKFYMKKRTFKFMHKRLENACFLSQICPK